MLLMKSKVACKLRIKPTTTGATAPTSDRKSMCASQLSTKEEPELAAGITRTHAGEPVSNGLIFQQLRSTEIRPSAKTEPFSMKQEPKQVPRLNSKQQRPVRPELIVLDDDEPVVPKKEEPLLQSSRRCTDDEVIVLDSDDDTVTRPVLAHANAVGCAHPPSDDSDREIVKRRRKSGSGPFNRRKDGSGHAQPPAGPDLQGGGDNMKSTLEKYLRIIASTARGGASSTEQEIQGSPGPSRDEVESDESAARPEDADPGRPKSSSQTSPRDESSVKQEQRSRKREQSSEKSAQPEFDTDLPSDWFAPSSRDTHNETDEPFHRIPPPQPDVKAEKQKRHSQASRSRRLVDFCASNGEEEGNGTCGNDTLAQRSPTQAEPEHSSISRGQVDQKSLRQQWRKYWIVDQRRSISGKRGRSERETSPEGGIEERIRKNSPDVNRVKKGTEEESDMDPDEVNFSPTHRLRRKSHGVTERAEKDRDARAQRRAAEAQGTDVPWSQMVDRKPRVEDHKRNVVIKVREGRKNLEYSFVKPRKKPFRDLREELQLYAEVPPNVKFELKYRKRVIKDTDTPESLGILYSAKVRAVRRERPDDDSSDGVTEVERKRRRENLIKVTVQDENGKKHTFQHGKKRKFRSLFHAFAKMCQNDIRAYRFFFDGKRLSYDDRPLDCEDFEDGALIDAFFETTGGAI